MTLQAGYFADPAAFLRRYACRMPGSGNDGGGIPGRAGDFLKTKVDVNGKDRTFKMGYDFDAEPVRVAWREVRDREVQLYVEGSNATNALQNPIAGAEWFDAYFLPWNQGCSARIQIPGGGSTRAFFTAEMNGCSFLVGGTPVSPWAVHLNVGDVPNATAREEKWERMAKGSAQDRDLGSAASLRKWGTVPVAQHASAGVAGLATTMPTYGTNAVEERRAESKLAWQMAFDNEKVTDGNAPIMDLRVATMGLRDDRGNWSFFYQRNMFVQQTGVKTRLGRLGGLKKKLGMDHRVARTLSRYLQIRGSEYLPLWPTGGGRLHVPPAPADDDAVDLEALFR